MVAEGAPVTRTVSLRPLVPSDLDAMWAARTGSDAPWADTRDGARRKLRERIGRSGRLAIRGLVGYRITPSEKRTFKEVHVQIGLTIAIGAAR